ncbi:hypothetical protein B0H13DRAFT_2338876 [Mycena leptocephala]|nr:hypothetical protein B0H13DRAFT_2338876 [Mycena leptocephala]
MHHCLQISEIVDIVCSHLDPPADLLREGAGNKLRFQDLAAIARKCTAFNGPALDYLWRSATLPVGRLLKRCMPYDLWGIDAVQSLIFGTVKKARLLRPICISDWDRLRLYAPRVKELACRDEWSLSKIFSALSLSLPETLLSSLRTLRWQHYDDDPLHPPFSPPHAHKNLFSHIVRLRRLRALDVSVEMPQINRYFGLECAESIWVPYLDQRALERLPGLSTLNFLALNTFPASLALSLAHLITAAENQSLFTAITASLSHLTLKNLTLEYHCDSDARNPAIYLVPYDSLQLLTTVCITTPSVLI